MYEKAFTERKSLVHKISHTKEKPHKCNLCDNEFSTSSGLTNHKRTHTKEKPFICNLSNNVFYNGSDLTKHIISHNGGGNFLI